MFEHVVAVRRVLVSPWWPASSLSEGKWMFFQSEYCRPELIHPFASAIDSPDLEVPDTLVRGIFYLWITQLLTRAGPRYASSWTPNQITSVFLKAQRWHIRIMDRTLWRVGTKSITVMLHNMSFEGIILCINCYCSPQDEIGFYEPTTCGWTVRCMMCIRGMRDPTTCHFQFSNSGTTHVISKFCV